MKDKLKKLEREQDEATLEFWEAIRSRDEAEGRYRMAEINMRDAKAAYLREKLGKL